MSKTKRYSISVLGHHVGSVWADKVQMGDEFGCSDDGMWFVIGDETALVLTVRPGIEVSCQDGDESIALTPDSIRAANQKESSGTAQSVAE